MAQNYQIAELGQYLTVNTAANSVSINATATFAANVTISNSAVIVANGSFGAANTVLTSNGTGMYWAPASGGLAQSKVLALTMTLGF